jgi:hypothetical protein
MNGDIECLMNCQEFRTGSWILNTRNYDGELAKIVGPLLGWKRESAPSHDFVTSRGEKVEVKKFKNGNGWLAGSNIAKTPQDVQYMFVVYDKNNTVTKIIQSDIEKVLDYIQKDFPLDLLLNVSKYKAANCQIRIKCSEIEAKEYAC